MTVANWKLSEEIFMKELYKIIAVDMDGTLLKSDKTIHKDSITHMHDFHMEVY